MDDATQKLVDEGTYWVEQGGDVDDTAIEDLFNRALGLIARLTAALEAVQRSDDERVARLMAAVSPLGYGSALALIEAETRMLAEQRLAQRPPVSGDYTHVVNLARASEAADKGLDSLVDYLADLPTVEEWRPPVSPEVRKEMIETIRNVDLADVQGTFRLDSVESGNVTDALLARFLFPSQPVYDEEKIARWLHDAPGLDWLATSPRELAAALVAALPGLTKEENEASSWWVPGRALADIRRAQQIQSGTSSDSERSTT